MKRKSLYIMCFSIVLFLFTFFGNIDTSKAWVDPRYPNWEVYTCPGGWFNWARCEPGDPEECDVIKDQWPCPGNQ